jgi:peptidoglycan hydrolase-like protein with peptidoglycan-binding domain
MAVCGPRTVQVGVSVTAYNRVKKVPRRSVRRQSNMFDVAGRVAAAIGRHPREFVAVVMATLAAFAIAANALFLQKGPHPAPIFPTRPLLQHEVALPPRLQPAQSTAAVESGNQAKLIANIQRELSRKGFYDGPADGIWGAKTDAAVRDFIHAAGLKTNAEPSDGLLRTIVSSSARAANTVIPPNAAPDPIAKLIAPSKRVMAVQRTLADFGYGQIKATGISDPDTRVTIEKFERDRRLPITGQISDRVVRELSAMTGRPLE